MTRFLWTLVALILIGCKGLGGNEMTESADPRSKIIAEIGEINDFSLPRPLVSLETFFEGNSDYGSIGYNFYPDQPSPSEFYRLFKQIRGFAEVCDVLVQVQQHEDPEAWPSTDTVWVITRASNAEVTEWLGKRFQPDELLEGIPDGVQSVEIPPGCRALGIWYD